jgi:hypothetical protein
MKDKVCRICGCTQDKACENGCSWVEEDLCSSCDEFIDTEDESDDEAVAKEEPPKQEAVLEEHSPNTAQEKLDNEFNLFKGSGMKAVVSKPTLDTLKMFCKNEMFAEAVLKNPNTFTQCIDKIMAGVGNAISDLEVYQRAAAFYFPNAKISFSMFIETDGLEVPVMEKEIKANIPPRQETQSNIVVKEKENKIEIDLNDLLADL